MEGSVLVCWLVLCLMGVVFAQEEAEQKARELPKPGLEVYVTKAELEAFREKMKDKSSLPAQIYNGCRRVNFVTLAFDYLVTGTEEAKKKALEAMPEIPSVGDVKAWDNYNLGDYMVPHFGSGMRARQFLAYLDWMWDGMTEEQRAEYIEKLADALRYQWRVGLLCDGHCMLHPRLHTNQAVTYTSSWMTVAAGLRKHISDGERMFRSALQTFLWEMGIIGDPDGSDVLREDHGYRACAISAYLAGCEGMLRTTGVDLYTQPFMRLMGRPFSVYMGVVRPYNPNGSRQEVAPGDILTTTMIWGNPTHKLRPGLRFMDMMFAQRVNDPVAKYFWNKLSVDSNGSLKSKRVDARGTGHLMGLSGPLATLWSAIAPIPNDVKELSVDPLHVSRAFSYIKIRTGTSIGDILCMSGSDYFFLDAYDESLISGQHGGWHEPLYAQARGRSSVLVEEFGKPIHQPVEDVLSTDELNLVKARNPVSYQESFMAGHGTSIDGWEFYKKRDRIIAFAKPDYFVVVDEVELADEKSKRRMEQQWMYNVLLGQKVKVDEKTGVISLKRPLAALETYAAYPDESAMEGRMMSMHVGHSYECNDGIYAVRIGKRAAGETNKTKPVEIAWEKWALVKNEKRKPPADAPEHPVLSTDPEEKKANVAFIETIPDEWDRQYNSPDIPVEGGKLYDLRFAFRKESMKLGQGTLFAQNPGKAFFVDISYMDKDSKEFGRRHIYLPHVKKENCGWTDVRWRVEPPKNATAVRFTMRIWHMPRGKGTQSPGKMWFKPFIVAPYSGTNVVKDSSAQFFTLLVPRKAGEDAAKVTREQAGDATQAVVEFRDRKDTWIYNRGSDTVSVPAGSTDAKLVFLGHHESGKAKVVSVFHGSSLKADSLGVSVEADSPLLMTLEVKEDGSIQGKGRTAAPTEVKISLAGVKGSFRLDSGYSVVSFKNGKWATKGSQNPTDLTHTNDEESAAYARGMEPLTKLLLAERDDTGRLVNHALKGTASASGSLDERFAPAHVIDNKVVEYGEDGRVDFRLGHTRVRSHPFGWYSPIMEIPLRVRPTYWLLPTKKTGSVTVDLGEAKTISKIRLLNTQHQGQNDRAAIDYRVEIETSDGQKKEIHKARFGDPLPPKKFIGKSYPENWGNTYADDTPVPLYLGWQDIDLAKPMKVKKVTVHVDSYWGQGGGLNEIQVLGPKRLLGRH